MWPCVCPGAPTLNNFNFTFVCSLITKLIFYLCMPIVIFLYRAIWLAAGAGSFLRYLDMVQKSYFLATNRGVKTVFKLKTLPKKLKNPPWISILNIVKYSELTSIDLVPSLKSTFLRTKCLKNKYKQWKTLASATCIQLYSSKNIRINTTTYFLN